MGLKSTEHRDDPWHKKPYDLYQPIYTGGATYESLLNERRYRRHANNFWPNNQNMAVPTSLENLLMMKINFEKQYPMLYKTMIGDLKNDKNTKITITPPEIPQEVVSYPNVELAAAEIGHWDKIIDRMHARERQPMPEQWEMPATSFEPLINNHNGDVEIWQQTDEQKNKIEQAAKQAAVMNAHKSSTSSYASSSSSSSLSSSSSFLPSNLPSSLSSAEESLSLRSTSSPSATASPSPPLSSFHSYDIDDNELLYDHQRHERNNHQTHAPAETLSFWQQLEAQEELEQQRLRQHEQLQRQQHQQHHHQHQRHQHHHQHNQWSKAREEDLDYYDE